MGRKSFVVKAQTVYSGDLCGNKEQAASPSPSDLIRGPFLPVCLRLSPRGVFPVKSMHKREAGSCPRAARSTRSET